MRPWEFARADFDLAEWYELREVMGWYQTYHREEMQRIRRPAKHDDDSPDEQTGPHRSRTI